MSDSEADVTQPADDVKPLAEPAPKAFVRGQQGGGSASPVSSGARPVVSDPVPVPTTGRKPEFGKYIVDKRVIGGKSECWEAHDLRTEGKCFLKIMPSPTFPSEEFRSVEPVAYATEVNSCNTWFGVQERIWERLKEVKPGSGSLVVPSDFFLHERRYVKVYPKVDSKGSLTHEEATMWDQVTRERFVRSLLFALHDLHSRGVVHADIKKENILVVERPAGLIARLIDFDDAYESGSPPSIVRGTPELYSPEVLRNSYPEDFAEFESHPLTCASDVFSLALVLHEVFSARGQFPVWNGDGSNDPAHRAMLGQIPAYDSLGFGSEEFRARLQQCLRPRPSERPSVEYLMTALGLNYE
jgi:serine/threonine protein kinase